MACGYWKLGLHERKAVFHHIFRKHPFGGNYAVSAGLASVVAYLREWRFQPAELDYLQGLKAPGGGMLFPSEFLDYLSALRFSCDVDAIPEGVLVFPHEPLLRVTGPLLQGQLLETALLDLVNFQTLIATKAARVCQAAGFDEVLEFGLRRAQGPDGGLSASRAAYIGGCMATSNVLAGLQFGIPVSGTHAHSWVTVFDNERAAFDAYAETMSNNFVLLVDTYDTRRGVQNAIATAKRMREKGVELRAIRLDSGDLALLSIEARKALDAAGFPEVSIIASNSLDEYVITSLKKQGAKISIWGVGTNLVTAYDHPALDGVYKLSAIQDESGQWGRRIKLSEQVEKVSNPGILQVRRYYQSDQLVTDVIYDELTGIPESPERVTLESPHVTTPVTSFDSIKDLLQPVFRNGQEVAVLPDIQTIRSQCRNTVSQFVSQYGTAEYPLGLEKALHTVKQQQVKKLRQESGLN